MASKPDGYALVRVKDNSNGAEYTTSLAAAQADGITVLDGRPAVDEFGAHLPPKPSTPKGSAPTSKES